MINTGIIFDMDGVLIDSNPYHKIALDIFLTEKGFSLTEEDRKNRLYGRANKDWINDLYNGKLSTNELKVLGNEKEVIWRREYAPYIKPVAGLIQFLTQLKQIGIPMAVGTSAPSDNVDFTFKKIGIGHFFDAVLDEKDVTIGKPHPEIYINCCKALHLAPQYSIVFEDSISGVKAGLDAGCKVVGVLTTHTMEELVGCSMYISDYQNLDPKEVINLCNEVTQ
ncbi:MAG: HAD family phosphatase [Cytophagales bacterium]|nr:HAD family phosphatase [Cytophagales bacterium]